LLYKVFSVAGGGSYDVLNRFEYFSGRNID
jgi:hypothetical protein